MIGSELKAWRKRHGYTQDSFAEELDCSRQTVISWEKSSEQLPRMVWLSLVALEGFPKERKVDGRRLSAAEYREERQRSPQL